MKLLCCLIGLAATLALPAAARGGEQAYLAWTLGEQGGRPTVSWTISGSTKWYVAVVQVAGRPEVNGKGDFLPENLIAYEVLKPSESTGSWVGEPTLGPGTYYGRLKLRYDGPCQQNCQVTTSIRSFTIDPPALGKLKWRAAAGIGKVKVSWKKPRKGWYVSMVLVDDDRDFRSPEDGSVWPAGNTARRWATGLLPRGTYYVRVRALYGDCDTCVWTSPTKKVVLRRTNSPPRLGPARFEIAKEAAEGARHTWKATFKACDRTKGKLRLEIVESTGLPGAGPSGTKRTMRRLAEPGGCRTYTVKKRSAFPFGEENYVRVAIRVRDALGIWSTKTRKVTWKPSA